MFEKYQRNKKWSVYVKGLQDFFTANKTADEKKVALFLEFVGEEICQLLNDLLYPVKPDSKSFKELVECLQKHFESPKVKIAERCKLLKRLQKKDETIAEYAQSLRELAETCQYGEFLNDALTQCFVCGLADSVIQRRLLLKEDLRFENALDFASTMEKADLKVDNPERAPKKEDKKLHPSSSEKTSTLPCFRCNAYGHSASKCRFKNARCFCCGKFGHTAKTCSTKTSKVKSSASKSGKKNSKMSKNLEVVADLSKTQKEGASLSKIKKKDADLPKHQQQTTLDSSKSRQSTASSSINRKEATKAPEPKNQTKDTSLTKSRKGGTDSTKKTKKDTIASEVRDKSSSSSNDQKSAAVLSSNVKTDASLSKDRTENSSTFREKNVDVMKNQKKDSSSAKNKERSSPLLSVNPSEDSSLSNCLDENWDSTKTWEKVSSSATHREEKTVTIKIEQKENDISKTQSESIHLSKDGDKDTSLIVNEQANKLLLSSNRKRENNNLLTNRTSKPIEKTDTSTDLKDDTTLSQRASGDVFCVKNRKDYNESLRKMEDNKSYFMNHDREEQTRSIRNSKKNINFFSDQKEIGRLSEKLENEACFSRNAKEAQNWKKRESSSKLIK